MSTASSEFALEMRGCAVERGGRLLLRDFNLTLSCGEAALLTGANGVGKSSLLRMIAGLLPITAGTMDRPERVALCDDRLALDPARTVRQALQFWADIDGQSENRLDSAMTAMALDGLADVPVRLLSTGQRQRARLARTIAQGARLWLLDEPANGLDGASVDLLGRAMAEFLRSGGAILCASHITVPVTFSQVRDMGPQTADSVS